MSIATASRSSTPAPANTLSRELAAVAGAAGVVATGAGEAEAVTYTPTAGVVAAQGIPGFSFVDATNVTLGSLRPPATAGDTNWDVDGSGLRDFVLSNTAGSRAVLVGFGPQANQGTFRAAGGYLSNLLTGAAVRQTFTWVNGQGAFTMSSDGTRFSQNNFTLNTPGQFGFRFTNGIDTHYGWGSLVIDGTPATQGQGFQITEAYYNSTPDGSITVGAVPVAVPEPSGMALLGLGAAGIAAWRARRKVKTEAGAEPEV